MQLAMAKLIMTFFKQGNRKALYNLSNQLRLHPTQMLTRAHITIGDALKASKPAKSLTRAEKLRKKPTVQDKLNEINNNPEMIDNIMGNFQKAMKRNVKKYNK
tara:strand:- start:278 stop:586 length:309 start_codon:yes stop_codon:yes gene_type:complete